MSEFIGKYGEKAREDDIELAHATAIALDGLIGPAQKKVSKIKEETQRESHEVMVFLEYEHHLRAEEGKNALFPNLSKLYPVSITVEEYDSYDLKIRARLLLEARINRTTLLDLIKLTGGVDLDSLPAPAAQRLLRDYSEEYNYFVKKGRNEPTYQGARHPEAFSDTTEFNRLHHAYITGESELEIE